MSSRSGLRSCEPVGVRPMVGGRSWLCWGYPLDNIRIIGVCPEQLHEGEGEGEGEGEQG